MCISHNIFSSLSLQLQLTGLESSLPKPPISVNAYETVQPVPKSRVVSDGASTPQSNAESPTSTVPPPVPQKSVDLKTPPPFSSQPDREEDPIAVAYAETVTTKLSTAPSPKSADNVVYHEIQGFQNSQVPPPLSSNVKHTHNSPSSFIYPIQNMGQKQSK